MFKEDEVQVLVGPPINSVYLTQMFLVSILKLSSGMCLNYDNLLVKQDNNFSS